MYEGTLRYCLKNTYAAAEIMDPFRLAAGVLAVVDALGQLGFVASRSAFKVRQSVA